MAGRESFGALP
jgi:Nitronate monooxygenase